MKAGAPQGIEIAPANDFGEFRRPNPSPASIFSKISTFRHHGCMHQGCRLMSSSRCGPRRALILGEDQAMMVSDDLILRDFHLRPVCESQTPEKKRNVIIDANAVRRAISPVPVLLFGVTTLRVTCNTTWARRKALKSRQRAILVDLEGRTPHQRQYFRKIRHFDTTGTCTKAAGSFTARAVGHAER